MTPPRHLTLTESALRDAADTLRKLRTAMLAAREFQDEPALDALLTARIDVDASIESASLIAQGLCIAKRDDAEVVDFARDTSRKCDRVRGWVAHGLVSVDDAETYVLRFERWAGWYSARAAERAECESIEGGVSA